MDTVWTVTIIIANTAEIIENAVFSSEEKAEKFLADRLSSYYYEDFGEETTVFHDNSERSAKFLNTANLLGVDYEFGSMVVDYYAR